MTEVYLSLPQPKTEIVYSGSRSVAPASLNARSDDGEMLPRSSRLEHSVHHRLAWQQGEAQSISLLGAPRSGDPKISRGVMDAAIQALIEKAVSDALERAAKRVETLAGNLPYEKAWRRAAKEIRAFKPN